MGAAVKQDFSWPELVKEVCTEIGKITGNVLGDKQFPMVESRLKRRCSELRLMTAYDYKNHWDKNRDSENQHLVGLLTTHFTSFFREFLHFEWIARELPTLVAAAKKEGRSSIKIWSAASSKGQEIWSLCMWMHHHMPKIDPKMSWSVTGSDIDPVSVKEGENGVYHKRELETAPRHLWEGLWVRGKGDIADWYKVKKELKDHAKFQVMNLLKVDMPVSEKFDIILCRNVLIYFDRPNQENIAKALLKYLTPQGALITGTSESLSGLGLPIENVSASIYKSKSATSSAPKIVQAPVETVSDTVPNPLKVFCVDDSPTVLTIMKKVLSGNGFEIVGTASNGQEAIEKLKTLKPDVITLDLHMPVMDGPTFLKTSGAAKEYPVVVVSSVGRDHAQITDPLFEMGIIDFVEKPTLTNMNDVADEIKQKLKMGWLSKKKSFLRPVERTTQVKKRPNGHVVFNFKNVDKIYEAVSQSDWRGDELTFIFRGSDTEFKLIKEKLKLKTSAAKNVSFLLETDSIKASSLPTIWFHFAGASMLSVQKNRRKQDFFVAEEYQSLSPEIKDYADDISPVTSFSYLVDKLFSGE